MDAKKPNEKQRKLFCTSQGLSLLRPPEGEDVRTYLSGDRFWDERHQGRGGKDVRRGDDPWRPVPRLDWDGVLSFDVLLDVLYARTGGPGGSLSRSLARGGIRRFAVRPSVRFDWGGNSNDQIMFSRDGGKPGLLTRLSARGDIKRLAVVCTGGSGKSANLEYLAAMLTTVGLVPFRFVLDEKGQKLPDNAATFWTRTLPEVFSRGKNSDLVKDPPKAQRILGTCRASGRLALLFDSVDQATPNGLAVLRGLLSDPAWSGCPVILSARPHAIYDMWEALIRPDVSAWHFLRVEPLTAEQRHLLLGPEVLKPDGRPDLDTRRQRGAELYERLPAAGRWLMENPRHIEYVRRCGRRPPRPTGVGPVQDPADLADYALEDLRTASHLFAGAVDHDVRLGLKAEGTERLGRKRNRRVASTQEEYALDLLAAFAYAMYRLPDPDQERDGSESIRPNVSRVPRTAVGALIADVVDLLAAAGLVKDGYDETELETVDLPALNALNAGARHDLLDTELRRQTDFRWHDRSLQEFLAAWWLSRYATAADRKYLRQAQSNDCEFISFDGKDEFQPLWDYLVDMPPAVRREPWVEAVAVLFESDGSPWCSMIHRCWPTMTQYERGRAVIAQWQSQFAALRTQEPIAAALWAELSHGHQADDSLSTPQDANSAITSGDTPGTVARTLITNEQYALFNRCPTLPTLSAVALYEYQFQIEATTGVTPAIVEAARRQWEYHPRTRLKWYEAWCFARWVGGRLPTPGEWVEAAGRGRITPFREADRAASWDVVRRAASDGGPAYRPSLQEATAYPPKGREIWDVIDGVARLHPEGEAVLWHRVLDLFPPIRGEWCENGGEWVTDTDSGLQFEAATFSGGWRKYAEVGFRICFPSPPLSEGRQ